MGREWGIKQVHKGPLLFMGVTQSGWALIPLYGIKYEVQSTGTGSQHVHMSYITYVFTHTNLQITCRAIEEKQQVLLEYQQNWHHKTLISFIKTISNFWFLGLYEQIRLPDSFRYSGCKYQLIFIWCRLAVYFSYINSYLQFLINVNFITLSIIL